MGNDSKTEQLISMISEKNVFLAKALNGLMDKLTQDEKDGLAALLNFYTKSGGGATQYNILQNAI